MQAAKIGARRRDRILLLFQPVACINIQGGDEPSSATKFLEWIDVMVRSFATLGTLALSWFMLVMSNGAFAQDRTERINFPSGRTSKIIRGSVTGYDAVSYLVRVRAGQRLAVSLRTDNDSNYFNVISPGASEALFNGSISGSQSDTIVPSSGNYRVQVYLMRNAARRGETARYRMTVEVTGGAPANDDEGDFADGLSGGPDYWEVANVPAGDRLNIRTRPAASAPVVARLRNGAVLRNLGCRMSGITRWCRVERRNGGGAGWAAGRFLIESGG